MHVHKCTHGSERVKTSFTVYLSVLGCSVLSIGKVSKWLLMVMFIQCQRVLYYKADGFC